MNYNCNICSQEIKLYELTDKPQGDCHLCYFCRLFFKLLAVSEYEFHQMINCNECGLHGFPCQSCAKHCFEGKLGPGYPHSEAYDIKGLLTVWTQKFQSDQNKK